MTTISSAAEVARENARAADGRFAQQAHSEPEVGIDPSGSEWGDLSDFMLQQEPLHIEPGVGVVFRQPDGQAIPARVRAVAGEDIQLERRYTESRSGSYLDDIDDDDQRDVWFTSRHYIEEDPDWDDGPHIMTADIIGRSDQYVDAIGRLDEDDLTEFDNVWEARVGDDAEEGYGPAQDHADVLYERATADFSRALAVDSQIRRVEEKLAELREVHKRKAQGAWFLIHNAFTAHAAHALRERVSEDLLTDEEYDLLTDDVDRILSRHGG